MARLPRKLKIQTLPKNNSADDQRVHFDNSNSRNAEEHYGHYLMCKLSESEVENNFPPRIYLSLLSNDRKCFIFGDGYGLEYLKENSLVGEKFKHYVLGKSIVKIAFKNRKPRRLTIGIIRGLRYLVGYLDATKQTFCCITDIDTDTQKEVYNHIELTGNTTALRNFRDLLKVIKIETPEFQVVKYQIIAKSSNSKKTTALPSSIVYQLEHWSTEEIESIIKEDSGLSSIEGGMPKKGVKRDKTCFNMYKMYPFVLYLMIKHGLNFETLNSWKIKKQDDGDYHLVADTLEMFTVIEGFKGRSNAPITSVVGNKTPEKKYIDFLLRHLAPIYEISKSSNFLQYYNCTYPGKVMLLKGSFFSNIRLTTYEHSFYRKHEILDLEGKRITHIDHRALRKSHNYQDHLRGKSEYERQVRKGHKSASTTKTYYEDLNNEWKEAKTHKIALAQNLVVGVFTGEISREEHKTAELINGALADCKDNKNPTFTGAPTLKENEYCSDWTKCLSQCDKCKVIPKIHGGVIHAWIKYMKDEKLEFLREQDWEKEYLVDYLSAKDTIRHFTPDELEYSEKEAYKHMDFVRMTMMFKKTIKIQGDNLA